MIFILLLVGCQSEVKESATEKTETEEMSSAANQGNTETAYAEEREPTDDEIREFGRIMAIEDGPYPMFVITVEFPERKMKADFNLNIESISLTMSRLQKLKGKYATIYYLSEMKQDLYDIHRNGVSLMGEYAPEIDPSWKTITGTLIRASAETDGDLPDVVSVKDKIGNKTSFEFFITAEMVAANEKEVTAFYSEEYVETITYLRASGD